MSLGESQGVDRAGPSEVSRRHPVSLPSQLREGAPAILGSHLLPLSSETQRQPPRFPPRPEHTAFFSADVCHPLRCLLGTPVLTQDPQISQDHLPPAKPFCYRRVMSIRFNL